MTVPPLILTHIDTGVRFFHQNDERAFFEWLSRIPCVEGYAGDGKNGLVAQLKRRPGKDDLRQLLALCHRYGVDMRQLAKFKTANNRSWFCDPKKYWYQDVLGRYQTRQQTNVPRMLRNAPRLRRGALLIRGPSSISHAWVPALRSSVKNAAPRPGHEDHPRANIRASLRSTGATASIKRTAAASTLRPAVSTTAEARA